MVVVRNKLESASLALIQIQEQASTQFPSHEEEEISPRSMNTLSMSQVEEPEYEEIWDEFFSNLTLEIDGSHTPTGEEPFREQIDLIPFDFDQVREVDELDKMIGEETHQDDSSKTEKIEHKADLVLCRRPPVVTGARPLDLNNPQILDFRILRRFLPHGRPPEKDSARPLALLDFTEGLSCCRRPPAEIVPALPPAWPSFTLNSVCVGDGLVIKTMIGIHSTPTLNGNLFLFHFIMIDLGNFF